MSRQIKFRGYVKDISDFGDDVVPHKGHFVFGNLVQDKGSSYIVGGMVEANDEYATLEYWQPVGNENVDEFTGLKDINGKEIYERDILATSSKIGGKLITDYLKVDWREDYAGFFCGEKPLYACLGEWDNDIKYPQTFPEIVGNVHTNPELLEAEK